MSKIDLNGFSFLERLKFKIKRNKLDFREIKVLPKKNVIIKTNTVFVGKHKGEIKIESNCYFIHRGELQGKLYITLLQSQTDTNNNPFPVTPAQLKGNCINVNNLNEEVLGYFRLGEIDIINYTIQ